MSRPLSARSRSGLAAAQHQHGHEAEEDDDALFGVVNDDQDEEDDEIDLDAYEAYLDDIKTKAAARPQSARLMRPYPTESPQFYMVDASNPVNPIDLSSITTQPSATTRATTRPGARPMSARPRMNSGEDSLRPTAPVPRAPQTARPSSASAGVRRRRQGSAAGSSTGTAALNARIRAVYNDVGRASSSTGSVSKASATVVSASHTATSVMQSRLKVFQDAELQHEYHRLVDVVADLRSVVQHEQAQRLKAMARVRRLEEIVTMKDKKIESLLHAQGSASVIGHGSDSSSFAALAQREMAQKERLHHAVMQKLRHKLAQQSQILASYEEAMQALRSNIKSTSLMEMEEEKQQLSIEVARLHEFASALQAELELKDRKLAECMGGDAQYQAQLGRLQQELKRSAHEKHKLEQETLFLKATVHQLEHKLALEQKKRAYDQALASGGRMLSGSRSPSSSAKNSPRFILSPTSSVRSPTSTSFVAEALAEMKTLRAEPSSVPTALPAKTRRPTPLPTKAQLELCEAEDAAESEHERMKHASPVVERSVVSEAAVGSCIEESMATLTGVLGIRAASEEVTKKRVRWQTADGEDEDEEEADEQREEPSVVHPKQVKGEGELVNATRNETRAEAEEEENRNEDVEQVAVKQAVAASVEDHELRIAEDTPCKTGGMEDDDDDDRSSKENDDEAGPSLVSDDSLKEEDANLQSSSREEMEDIERHHAPPDEEKAEDNEKKEEEEEEDDEEEEEEEDEETNSVKDASLSRTNSSDSSHSSSSNGSTNSSSSSSLRHSASSDSTSSTGSSSLSSLLAQEDAAAMALEATTQRTAAEDPSDVRADDAEPEELQYASDFSDAAE